MISFLTKIKLKAFKNINKIISFLLSFIIVLNTLSVLHVNAVDYESESNFSDNGVDISQLYTAETDGYDASVSASSVVDTDYPVYVDGRILIYSYAQFLKIGSNELLRAYDGEEDRLSSGSTVTSTDSKGNVTPVTYSADASYSIASDFAVPEGTTPKLPTDFSGEIAPLSKSESRPLYDEKSNTVYLYNQYQLEALEKNSPILDGDASADTYSAGQPVLKGSEMLCYDSSHNYVISSQFTSEPISVAESNGIVSNELNALAQTEGENCEGRDFPGQVIKTIGDTQYILIGNAAQLRAIGQDGEVYTPAYQVKLNVGSTNYILDTDDNGDTIMLYGGDADYEIKYNGIVDTEFNTINDFQKGALQVRYATGVDQQTGEIILGNLSTVDSAYKTGVKYSRTANYIIFRDIDLGEGEDANWTPLMFSGTMIGAKADNVSDVSTLWSDSAVNTKNRPVISNVRVKQSEKLDTSEYIGIGFFATITDEVNTANVGVSTGQVLVENIKLKNVNVSNYSEKTESTQTLVSGLTSSLGWLVGGLVDLLTTVLTFGQVQLNLRDTLSALLNAREADPTSFATGAFAGRVVGNAIIRNCAVDTVSVYNIKSDTGGFVGYTVGVTQYDGLSGALGGITDFLSSLLNVIPGLGLGDLITILLQNGLALDSLIPTGYINPEFYGCTVENLSGVVGNTASDFAGGFAGRSVAARFFECEIINSSYTVYATNYSGGFAGASRDADIQGLLEDLGVELIRVAQPQTLFLDCSMTGTDVVLNGGNYSGGWTGVLANSYCVNCTMQGGSLAVNCSGDYAGGFAGIATMGWLTSVGKDEMNENVSLLSTVKELLVGLLSSDKTKGEALLTLVGLTPSAVLGCQMNYSTVTVSADGSYAGGFVGRGDALILGESSAENLEKTPFWKYDNEDTNRFTVAKRGCVLTGLTSVAANDYAGGVVGFVGTASVAGLLNGTLGVGDFKSFYLDNTVITGSDGGFTVEAKQMYSGGAVGMATGGEIAGVELFNLKSVKAQNRAAGFIASAGPGAVASSGGLELSLLGLKILDIKDLLSVGAAIRVKVSASGVTGISDGFTVEALGGSSSTGEYTASGFVAQSASTEMDNCHTVNLKSVKAPNENGYSGGFIGTSRSGDLADVAGDDSSVLNSFVEGGILNINGLLSAVSYLIPKYTDCTVTYVDGGAVEADIAGGFAADFQSGTVDNQSRGNDAFAVYNIASVSGQRYAGGFAGKLYSGALASAGKGISVLGNININIGISDLLSIAQVYVPKINCAGVRSGGVDSEGLKRGGFTVKAVKADSLDSNSGSAGGFAGYMSGAQVSYCDVNYLAHTVVTPPESFDNPDGTPYFNDSSAYAVSGGRYSGGFVGNMNIGSAASLGGGLEVLGTTINLTDVLSALSVVVSTIEHSTVSGGTGGFAVLATADGDKGKLGCSGGFAGSITGGQLQDCHAVNFSYVIGEISAGGYSGSMAPGNVADVLGDGGILKKLVNIDSLVSLVEDFVPTVRNSTTSSIPCGGAVRANAESDSTVKRGMAGGFCGHNEGGHIWGNNDDRWKDEYDAQYENSINKPYNGPQHPCEAIRISSVYGAEYAGGFTGLMEPADTAETGSISLLGELISIDNIADVLSVVYPTDENTAVYAPLSKLDYTEWNQWMKYVGKYGGMGAKLTTLGANKNGEMSSQSELDAYLDGYISGFEIAAGRTEHKQTLASEGGDAGGYVGLMETGVITNGQAYGVKSVKAMRSAGGFAGKMQVGGAASFGGVNLLGLNLDLGSLLNVAQVFVPAIKNSSVTGYQSGMTVSASSDDITHNCGYAGGYVGSAYGAQIWGDSGDTENKGCNAVNLRSVSGKNAVGGFAGIASAGMAASVNTQASDGFLQKILNSLLNTSSDLVQVLKATYTTIRGAEVSAFDKEWGYTVDGKYTDSTGNTNYARYAGGFAGYIDAAVIGDEDGLSQVKATDVRSVDGGLYAGGFFGLGDVGSLATVAKDEGGNETPILGGLLELGQVDVLSAFRAYVYHGTASGVNGDGLTVTAHTGGDVYTGELNGKRYKGCAGGFGGALLDGSVKASQITNLNTVEGMNYVGGFVGHLGKSGVAKADSASLLGEILNLDAGVGNIFGSHVENGCGVTGITDGFVVKARGGSQPIAGGFAGYADLARISNSQALQLKKVESDQIAGGFVGKTDMAYLVDANVDSQLVAVLTGVVNQLLDKLLHADDLENLGLIQVSLPFEIPGLGQILDLEVLSEGDLLSVTLLGLKISVALDKPNADGTTDAAIVTIGDSVIRLPVNADGTVDENAEIQINLIKGNRTEIEASSVSGIESGGYDVFGGNSSQTEDGIAQNGHSGGFVGYNNEGKLTDCSTQLCDAVRGTAEQVGPFSGTSSIVSSWQFNSLYKLEGTGNTYRVYRSGYPELTKILLSDGVTINDATVNEAIGGTVYNTYSVSHFNDVTQFTDLKDAVLSSDSSADKQELDVYRSDALCVLMLNSNNSDNYSTLVAEPNAAENPCDTCGYISLTVNVIWDDLDNLDGIRPDAVWVDVYQETPDGQKVLYKRVDVSKQENEQSFNVWSVTLNNVPEYDINGDEIKYYYSYSGEEEKVDGYISHTEQPQDYRIDAIYVHRPTLPVTGQTENTNTRYLYLLGSVLVLISLTGILYKRNKRGRTVKCM